MKTIEDHAMDIFHEYPGISMSDLALRLFLRMRIIPIIEKAINDINPELSNIVMPDDQETIQ